MFTRPWKNADEDQVGWVQAFSGNRVPMQSEIENSAAQIWTNKRGCILKVIWLEINIQIFNPNNRETQWLNRAHQAALDIQAHIESCRRRLPPNKKRLWRNTYAIY